MFKKIRHRPSRELDLTAVDLSIAARYSRGNVSAQLQQILTKDEFVKLQKEGDQAFEDIKKKMIV